jgi:peptidyl-dipeptidase Dcp
MLKNRACAIVISIMSMKKVSFDGAIDFSTVNLNEYKKNFQEGLKLARERFSKLKSQPSIQDSVQFMRAYSEMDLELSEVSSVFFNLLGSDGTPEMHAYAQEIQPELSKFGNEVALDLEIFKKIEQCRNEIKKTDFKEWSRFNDEVYRSFVRNGVNLPEDKKEILKKIDEELGLLSLKFQENIIKDTAAFELVVENEADLKGLPERNIEEAKQKAEAKNIKGFLLTLDAPTYIPFVTYVEKRELREKMWRAYATRCMKGEFDNKANCIRITNLKHQRALLLGFKSHADYVLKERMAKNPETVKEFLLRVVTVSKAKAEKELAELKEFAKAEGFKEEFKPWDSAFYAEKLKKKVLNFDEEELRPYFPMEKVIQGLFDHATRLFGITFAERVDIPKYHPENRVYEVKDSDGSYLGLFYLDLFPREKKRPGAWMTYFRGQGSVGGKKLRPHVVNVCNFTKPTATKPSLLSFDEVNTLFHEFGHASHELLSNCEVRGLAGTNVWWDFVELPSQIMENWVNNEEGLKLVASHFETGASLPNELIEKIKASKKFLAASASLRQAQLALLDMAWHHDGPLSTNPSLKLDEQTDVEAFETLTLKPFQTMEKIPGTSISPSFSHIFGGGYSAGYYSYKWAEVLDADAFEYFEEKGIYNREIADKFRREVLSRGNTEDPDVLYERFRGRKPDPDALFRRDGLL